jgi:hypothetical protein
MMLEAKADLTLVGLLSVRNAFKSLRGDFMELNGDQFRTSEKVPNQVNIFFDDASCIGLRARAKSVCLDVAADQAPPCSEACIYWLRTSMKRISSTGTQTDLAAARATDCPWSRSTRCSIRAPTDLQPLVRLCSSEQVDHRSSGLKWVELQSRQELPLPSSGLAA